MEPIFKKLKNGMPVILVPQKGAVSATVMVYVHVGSRYETRDVSGASHFVEHLMFKGTHKRPESLIITKELDRFGAEYNAFTGKDLTAYYIKIDAAKTLAAAEMLYDMLFHSLFDGKEIDRERGVIVEEINMYEDNPRSHVEDLLEEKLFPSSTLGWSIAGPRDVIKKVSRDALHSYHENYYIPSRMVVVVAGKLIPGLWPFLQKTFGSIKEPARKNDRPFDPFIAPAKLPEPIAFQSKETEQVQLGMAFLGFGYGDKRLPAANLLATILGGSMSSRLFTEVRERRGLCYAISASHQPLEDTGAFAIMAGLEKSSVQEAIRVIWKELKHTVDHALEPEEIRRAKDHIRGRLMLSFEDSANQADWYGRQWTLQKKLATPEERLRQIERVTAADMRRAAALIFRPEIMASAVIGPYKKETGVAHLFDIA